MTKVIDTLTQEDFHGAFQKLLERYNKSIAAGGDYFEGDSKVILMCVQLIKVHIRKKSGCSIPMIRICEMFVFIVIRIRKIQHSRNWFRYETFIHLFEFKGYST